MIATSSVVTVLIVGTVCMLVLAVGGALVAMVIVRRQNSSIPPRDHNREG